MVGLLLTPKKDKKKEVMSGVNIIHYYSEDTLRLSLDVVVVKQILKICQRGNKNTIITLKLHNSWAMKRWLCFQCFCKLGIFS